MKIFITGANGLLAQHLINLLVNTTDHEIIATSKREPHIVLQNSRVHYFNLDITDGLEVDRLLQKLQPDTIIHCAALTQVDECELEPIKAWEINVTATRFLVDAAKQINAFFIFLSTDFVFDGQSGPYKETDLVSPVNYYGSTKVAAEKAVEESGLQYAVVRTCLLYGSILNGTRNNIITWVKENLEQAKTIRVVNDQSRTPTYVSDLAKGILLIAEKKAEGIFHISGNKEMSPYQMAIQTADYLKLPTALIEKVDDASFTQAAKRPPVTGFIIKKAEAVLGFKPISLEEGLKNMYS